VDAIVEGTVAQSGERIRITAQLIRASDDRHLWAEEYVRDLTDILALQRRSGARDCKSNRDQADTSVAKGSRTDPFGSP
jgi:TolB-like protein